MTELCNVHFTLLLPSLIHPSLTGTDLSIASFKFVSEAVASKATALRYNTPASVSEHHAL